MKTLILFSLFLLSFFLFSGEIQGKVIGVSDGDTITVSDDLDNGVFRIRLDKIDAPEKKQAFGKKAEKYLSDLILGKQVSVRFKAIDRYGRILEIVFCGDVEINLKMVQEGFAWHYSFYDKTPAYAEVEKQARAARKGLWQEPHAVKPYDFRKMQKKRRFPPPEKIPRFS